MTHEDKPGFVCPEPPLKGPLMKRMGSFSLQELGAKPLSMFFVSTLAFLFISIFMFSIVSSFDLFASETLGTFSDVFGAIGGAVIALSGAIVAIILASKSIVIADVTNEIAKRQNEMSLQEFNASEWGEFLEGHNKAISPLLEAKKSLCLLMQDLSELSVLLKGLHIRSVAAELEGGGAEKLEVCIASILYDVTTLNRHLEEANRNEYSEILLRMLEADARNWKFRDYSNLSETSEPIEKKISSLAINFINLRNPNSLRSKEVRDFLLKGFKGIAADDTSKFISELGQESLEIARSRASSDNDSWNDPIILEGKHNEWDFNVYLSRLTGESSECFLREISDRLDIDSVLMFLRNFEENLRTVDAESLCRDYLNYYCSVQSRVRFDDFGWAKFTLGQLEDLEDVSEDDYLPCSGSDKGKYDSRSNKFFEYDRSCAFEDGLATLFGLKAHSELKRDVDEFQGKFIEAVASGFSSSAAPSSDGEDSYSFALRKFLKLSDDLESLHPALKKERNKIAEEQRTCLLKQRHHFGLKDANGYIEGGCEVQSDSSTNGHKDQEESTAQECSWKRRDKRAERNFKKNLKQNYGESVILSDFYVEFRSIIEVLDIFCKDSGVGVEDALNRDSFFFSGAVSIALLLEWFGEIKHFSDLRLEDERKSLRLEASDKGIEEGNQFEELIKLDHGGCPRFSKEKLFQLYSATKETLQSPSSYSSSKNSRRFLAAFINDPRAFLVSVRKADEKGFDQRSLRKPVYSRTR